MKIGNIDESVNEDRKNINLQILRNLSPAFDVFVNEIRGKDRPAMHYQVDAKYGDW